MALDGIVSSPHRRTQNSQSAFSPSSSKRQYTKGEELGSCSVLIQRHRFLLTALVLLTFLCTVYLYFAVTFTTPESCSGLTGTEKALCSANHVKDNIAKGKLKFF